MSDIRYIHTYFLDISQHLKLHFQFIPRFDFKIEHKTYENKKEKMENIINRIQVRRKKIYRKNQNNEMGKNFDCWLLRFHAVAVKKFSFRECNM